MKKLLTLLTLTAFAAAPATILAAPKKAVEAAPAAPAAPDKPAAPAAKADEAKPAKAVSMKTKVDAIDAAGKTFTHTNKDGTVVKFVVTDKTDIKNGVAAAKFEDIKVGDTVNGSRLKKNDAGTEYEVVKITRFGPTEAKAEVEKKVGGDKKAPAPAAPTEKKPN